MAQLLSNLPNGALVKFGKHQVGSETAQPIIWMVADKNHSGYPANSVTLITEKIIDLRPYDGKESVKWFDGNIDYRLSNLHQWLNSEGEAGKWYTASHNYDTPPSADYVGQGTGYYNRPGFLNNFTPEERLALLPTTMGTQTGAVNSSVVAKVFLPSLWEMLGTHTFSDGSSRLALFLTRGVQCGVTEQVITNTAYANKAGLTGNWSYMTRSTTTEYISYITATGETSISNPASGNNGVRPIINLSANSKVSDTIDTDGCYTVLPQTAPTITEMNSDIGIQYDGFKLSYTIDDVDNEPVTVTEYLDNVVLRTYVATLGGETAFDVTGKTWLTLANGNHTMKIVATDGFDEVTRTITFVKSIASLVAQRTTPIESPTRPKSIIVSVVKNIPTEALFKVEACNNGFDNQVVWEDITNDVVRGEIYDFNNEVCTSGRWGVNIRVTVDRNGAEGACYITEIGGNFE